jgi:CheY-like chemotaxis protein
MTGLELASRIRSSPDGGGMVLIALTGYGQPDDRRKTRAAGFDHHLVKPVAGEALRDVLAHAASQLS